MAWGGDFWVCNYGQYSDRVYAILHVVWTGGCYNHDWVDQISNLEKCTQSLVERLQSVWTYVGSKKEHDVEVFNRRPIKTHPYVVYLEEQ